MRNKLISYIDLLFAGNPDTEDIKQEILQNTLDRYDDLIAQGKTPEAAYSQTISGIGDISEIIGRTDSPNTTGDQPDTESSVKARKKKMISKVLIAVAVALYILCAVPVVVLQDELGVSLLLVMVAIATALLIIAGNQKRQVYEAQLTPRQKLRNSIHSAVSAVGLVVYIIISFMTGAWYITWLVFPIVGAINGIVSAFMDLKEAE